MKPEKGSRTALKVTQSRAKMFEYSVPAEAHIEIKKDPAELFPLTIGMLGNVAANLEQADTTLDDRKNLQFSAHFFNAYLEGKFRDDTDAYLLLLASAAFYLSHIPGSSLVLAKKIPLETLELGGGHLERLLHWLLLGAQNAFTGIVDDEFAKEVNECVVSLKSYYTGKIGREKCEECALALRKAGYNRGSPRQLLFADICASLIKLRIQNSARNCLPIYSRLPLNKWESILNKEGFLQELWPSQQLLGDKGIYNGISAIVQMPTSAGKTRATELIIRSAFIANRTSLAVIVAPFRALCHEISDALRGAFRGEHIFVDELTDILQPDFNFDILSSDDFEHIENKNVLVVTPEKLLYVLRHEPQLAESIGLVIYDEGHQFDSGIRGVTYELLLTSLKRQIPKDAQTILISAVISNAEAIGTWLLGNKLTIATGLNLSAMGRRIAFTGWNTELGQLHFMEEDLLEKDDFFVPRLISQLPLKKLGRERKRRHFPRKDDSNDIALYLGLKLVKNGSVAIFCGRKDTVSGICADIVDAYNRELNLPAPVTYSNQEEVSKLANLYELNLGINAPVLLAARLGFLSHNGNTPQGIRLSVENAMKEGDAKFIICTSTLAQGVNLPIKYLIITSVYQGGEQIKVRDFHNLIGRAGRAGMHVEGTILFADPKIYDGKRSREDSWRWSQAQQLLKQENSEPVVSSIQNLFKPFRSKDRKDDVAQVDLIKLANWYVNNKAEFQDALVEFANKKADKNITADDLLGQAHEKFKIFSAIESYLMAHWEESAENNFSQALAEGTLAYALILDDQKKQLVELFKILADHIRSTVPDAERRGVFARTLQGVTTNIELEKWVVEHLETLRQADSHEDLLRHLWPMIAGGIENKTFQKIDKPDLLIDVAFSWIAGAPFGDIFDALKNKGVQLNHGETRKKALIVEHVVDLCESAFGYDGALRIGAITDLLASRNTLDDEMLVLIELISELHKRFKYGLLETSAVTLYECGFADRVIAQDLSGLVSASMTRSEIIKSLVEQKQAAEKILEKYPKYFQTCLMGLLT